MHSKYSYLNRYSCAELNVFLSRLDEQGVIACTERGRGTVVYNWATLLTHSQNREWVNPFISPHSWEQYRYRRTLFGMKEEGVFLLVRRKFLRWTLFQPKATFRRHQWSAWIWRWCMDVQIDNARDLTGTSHPEDEVPQLEPKRPCGSYSWFID
jgi:hypothetical protein